MQAWRCLRHWSMLSSITLCYTPTHVANRFRLKSFTSCAFCARLAAPDFVMKCTEARAVRWPEVRKFYGSLTLLHFLTGGANDAQNVSVDTARRKDNDQQNLSKMIVWYCRVYNQITSDVWRYNNPVYKLMTNRLHLVLINVLISQFLNNKVLQGSVSTHLRCDGIFNDPFIAQSPPSPRVKKFGKSVNICRNYEQVSTGSFFYETPCIQHSKNYNDRPIRW